MWDFSLPFAELQEFPDHLISPAHRSPSFEQLCAHKQLSSSSLVSVASLLVVHSIHALHPSVQV